MKDKLRIGIFGSCISRDVFTTYYNDYKQHFQLVFSHERESLISLFQNPMSFDEEDIKISPPSKKNLFRIKNIFNDFSKSFFEDLNKGIDYLIIDIYFEVLFGILILDDGSIITNNKWDLPKTHLYKHLNIINKFEVYENPNKYFELWVLYCDKLFDFLKESYPNVKVILNKIRLADNVLKEDYSSYVNIDFKWIVDTYYPFIQKFEKHIEENYEVISIEYNGRVYTSENSRWNPYVIHLTEEYYKYVYYSICKNVGVDELHLLNSKLSYVASKLNYCDKTITNSDNIINSMQDEIYLLNKDIIEKNQIIKSYQMELDDLNKFKEEILNSSSWKVTKPLRNIKRKFR